MPEIKPGDFVFFPDGLLLAQSVDVTAFEAESLQKRQGAEDAVVVDVTGRVNNSEQQATIHVAFRPSDAANVAQMLMDAAVALAGPPRRRGSFGEPRR